MSQTLDKFASLVDTVAHRNRGRSYLLTLPRLCCLALGGSPDLARPITEITQLVCDAIILCDDVIDEDVTPAQWAPFIQQANTLPLARGTAVNVAMGLLARAGQHIQRLGQALDEVLVQEIQAAYYETLWQTAAGQQASLLPAQPTLAEAWETAAIKSGAYYGFACWIGACASAAGPAAAATFRRFGQTLGVLVQIGDDMGDLWARDGKSSDLQTGLWTLPVVYAMSVLPPADQAELERLLRQARAASADADGLQAEAAARRLIIGCGAMVYLHVELDRHYQVARQALLETAPPSPYRDDLLHVLAQTLSFLPA